MENNEEMITSTNDMIESPVCSTDNVWYKTNMEISSSEKFDALDSNIASLQSGKANTNHTHSNYALTTHTHSEYAPVNHTHDFPSDFIKTINKTYTLTGSGNSFSIDLDSGTLEEGKTYLFSFSYISSTNTLLDRSLYVVYYASSRVVPTYALAYCKNSTDSPMTANMSGKIRVLAQYNGDAAAKCELRIV